MSKDIRTVIDGYTVEYTPSNDNGLPDCHIWIVGSGRTFSSSLQALMENGFLDDAYGNEHRVKEEVIYEIEEWANAQGWDQ